MLDYLIIGDGIAGSVLGYELLRADKSVLIVSDENLPSSSLVAGGMFNPVTGKHLAKTWLADIIFPYLKTYYRDLEITFGRHFYHETGVYRPFKNENQRHQFVQAIAKHGLEAYINIVADSERYSAVVVNPLGGLLTTSAGWVDVPVLLAAFREYFVTRQAYAPLRVDYAQLQPTASAVTYQGYTARNVIFCEGFLARNNPFFNWLPFNPVKGETLIVSPDTPHAFTEIINQGGWVLPMNNQTYRLGATYSWHELDFVPTADGRKRLLEKVTPFFKPSFRIQSQSAGVRPATTDRRPFIGKHPAYPNVYIFNGLGTKGISLAPYWAAAFTAHLTNGKEIGQETTIERFYPLY